MSEVIRKATIDDKEQVEKLLFDNFGEMAVERGALDDFPYRYFVSEENGKVVALSGITDNSLFDGYEIRWTCCDKEYRHQGRVTRILKKCLDELPNDNKPVWCDAWRVRNKESCNLKSVFDNLGFKLYMVNIKVYNKLFMKVCKTCPYRNESIECHCVADLYKKER